MESPIWSNAQAGLLAVLVVVLSLVYVIWKKHPNYGANPGLPLFPLLGCLPSILLNKHRFYEWTSDVLNSTPSLTCRAPIPGHVGISTCNPANVQHILKTAFDFYPKGPDFYPFFADLLGSGIFNCDGTLWKLQRKVASYEFTSSSLRDFVIEIADAEICHHVLPTFHRYLHSSVASHMDANPGKLVNGCLIDIQALLLQFTFDVICKVTFGACGRDGNSNEMAKEFQKAFETAVKVTADRFLTPDLLWKAKRALRIGNERRLREALPVVEKFAKIVIEKCKRDLCQGVVRSDLLSRFMRLRGENFLGDQDSVAVDMSDSFLKDILLSFLLAGRESVASGATFLLWQLACHPEKEEAILVELDDIIKSRDPSATTNVRTFTFDELKRMNYLHAALSESMRLYPPAPSDCKYAAQDDKWPDGTCIRKGYQVSYNVFAMGRSDRVWGQDCLEFKPERWLSRDGEYVPESPYKYPVFQAGPRICLGKDFAYVEMKLLIAILLREFEFKVVPGFKPQLSFSVNLLMLNGLPVFVKRRNLPS